VTASLSLSAASYHDVDSGHRDSPGCGPSRSRCPRPGCLASPTRRCHCPGVTAPQTAGTRQPGPSDLDIMPVIRVCIWNPDRDHLPPVDRIWQNSTEMSVPCTDSDIVMSVPCTNLKVQTCLYLVHHDTNTFPGGQHERVCTSTCILLVYINQPVPKAYRK
jgi:hypothetical protein